MTLTMKKAYEVADRYLEGFHTTPDEVAAAFRKIGKSAHPAADSYLSRLEQKMDTDAIEDRFTGKPGKPGRPVVGDQVKIAFPAALLAAIDAAADAQGITRSEWVRRACAATLG